MKSARFFVTLVVILAISTAVARVLNQWQTGAHTSETGQRAVLVLEGNAKIRAALDLQSEIKNKFGADLSGAAAVNWRQLSKDERREIGSKLAQFLQLINRALEIDNVKNITIENREKITAARDAAENLQRGLEGFERVFGQKYEPKGLSVEHSQHKFGQDGTQSAEI